MFRWRVCMGLVLAVTVLAVGANAQQRRAKLPKVAAGSSSSSSSDDRSSTLAISGVASSARHCVGPGANVHELGSVPSNSQIEVTFVSDFDPVATVTVVQMGDDAPDDLARTSFVADDDSGGNLEPQIRFTTSHGGTLTLHVGKFSPNESAGCYFYKVEVRTP
jgi:hypothetical protein